MQPAVAYLDWASRAPLHPAAREALLAAYDSGWADPTRLHREGRQARLLFDAAREAAAGALGVRPPELSFTSSGTAAAQLAILGALKARRSPREELVTSAIEHSCVLHAAAEYARSGGRVRTLGVDAAGRVAADTVRPTPETALVSIQSANQEIGTVQPIAELAERCRAAGAPLHVDAAQSVGRVPVDAGSWDADLVTASAAKFGGPSGVGLLLVRERTRWARPGPEDDRGDGRLAGPLDVPGAVSTAAALLARSAEIEAEAARHHEFTARIRAVIAARVPDADLHGDPEPGGRLPHLVSMSFLYVDGEALLGELEREGIAAASGSACTASSLSPSHVLEAVGALTHGNLRVSLGRDTTADEVERLLDALPPAVARLRDAAGVGEL